MTSLTVYTLKTVGIVESGSGRAAGQIAQSPAEKWQPLGYTPYPGTLNVRLRSYAYRRLGEHGIPVDVTYHYTTRTFYEASVNKQPCHARFNRSEGTVELVAPVHLRHKLGLQDGDEVTLRWPTR